MPSAATAIGTCTDKPTVATVGPAHQLCLFELVLVELFLVMQRLKKVVQPAYDNGQKQSQHS
jgi:hypothetical protein